MTTTNTPSRVEEIVEHALGMETKFLEKKNWVEYIIRTTLTELEAETVPSSTFVEETKEAYHSGYLSGVAEKKRAVVAERERIIEVTTNSHKAFMVPQTIERWKAFITPKQTN